MSIYEKFDVSPIINASGAVTRIGGAPMPSSVVDAFVQAAGETVSLDHLQAAASLRIARITNAEAGLVTAGCAASLTLGAAAIITGLDPGRMEALPHCNGIPNEFIVAREQRGGYDHAVRASGAQFVEVGFNEIVSGAGVRRTELWEFEAAFSSGTAGVLVVYQPDMQPRLEEVVACAHSHEIPVLVDAAGQLPPRDNLSALSATGADLICFSGGKAIRGPQATGILCGRKDLIAAAALQMLDSDDHFELWDPPAHFIDKSKLTGIPRQGIGRAMKVAKEEIIAFLTALDLFVSGEYDQELKSQLACLDVIVSELQGYSATCDIIHPRDPERSALLEISIDQSTTGRSALDVCRALRQNSPPIYVGHGKLSEGVLVINPLWLDPAKSQTIASRLRVELGEKP